MGEPDRESLRRQLITWYRARKRDLPFRRTRDPYAILVAEIVLQRTRVAAGLPYFERFLTVFPTVGDLARSSESDVLRAWEGLGFYRRARNLHRAAKTIVERHGGELPADLVALRALPGIGEYTAGAVGSIAFGLRAPAVDGNATRVIARLFRVEDDVSRSAGKSRIRTLAEKLVPADTPGEWNQALMELGATTCVPRGPRCGVCPVATECLALSAGIQEAIPRVAAKKPVPVVPVVFVVARRGESVLLVRRGDGLHAGMYALPGGERRPGESAGGAARRSLAELGIRGSRWERIGPVRHTFSHRRWEGDAFRCAGGSESRSGEWIPIKGLARIPVVPLHRELLGRPAR